MANLLAPPIMEAMTERLIPLIQSEAETVDMMLTPLWTMNKQSFHADSQQLKVESKRHAVTFLIVDAPNAWNGKENTEES